MENTYHADMTTDIEESFSNGILEIVEKVISSGMDISSETNYIIEMTPKDGYQKKIELISTADDLSSKEKIKAIDDAETKYAQDLVANAEVYKGMMRTKIGLFLTGVAGVVLMMATPEGRKIAKSIIRFAT